jgi:hypothetical protein
MPSNAGAAGNNAGASGASGSAGAGPNAQIPGCVFLHWNTCHHDESDPGYPCPAYACASDVSWPSSCMCCEFPDAGPACAYKSACCRLTAPDGGGSPCPDCGLCALYECSGSLAQTRTCTCSRDIYGSSCAPGGLSTPCYACDCD